MNADMMHIILMITVILWPTIQIMDHQNQGTPAKILVP